jgi:ribonuclease G
VRRIIIHAREANRETRIAVVENGELVELMIERPEKRRLVGSIFKGRIVNVLPGMQAAFVDIGIGKNAFLYIDDILPANDTHQPHPKPSIEQLVKVGEQIIVQVTKEPLGSKGARVTTHLSFPGRMLVYMPLASYVAVSRKIEDEQERERLRALGEQACDPEEGMIIRTLAEALEPDELFADLPLLRKIWQKILLESDNIQAPAVLYRDMDLTSRVIRDLMTSQVDEIVIDRMDLAEHVKELVTYMGDWKERVTYYSDPQPIFEAVGLERELDRIFKRKIWLKSGGYLVVDRTEALTVIDVNTGKYTGSRTLEETVLQINREAALEAARQIRLRDIGGIIIIDFIDMQDEEHREQVLQIFGEALKKDRTKTHVYGLTKLGLIEMTRKKVRQNLEELLQCVCPACDGLGRIWRPDELWARLEREILSLSEESGEVVHVSLAPSNYEQLHEPDGLNRRHQLEERVKAKLAWSLDPSILPGRYRITK